jgi:hypothetical protein
MQQEVTKERQIHDVDIPLHSVVVCSCHLMLILKGGEKEDEAEQQNNR